MQKIYAPGIWINSCNTTYQKYILKTVFVCLRDSTVTEKRDLESKAELAPINKTCSLPTVMVLLHAPTTTVERWRVPLSCVFTRGEYRMCIATFTWVCAIGASCTPPQWQGLSYWYQGVLRTQRRVNPASVRILIEAASASLTVSLTDCIRFWALWTNISVAWTGEHLEVTRLRSNGKTSLVARAPGILVNHHRLYMYLLWLLLTDICSS